MVAGEFEGLGVEQCASGTVYFGEWAGDEKRGFGVLQFAEGHRYCGEFTADKADGYGVHRLQEGNSQSGTYRCGARLGDCIHESASGERTFCHVLDDSSETNAVPFDDTNADHARVLEAARSAEARAIRLNAMRSNYAKPR